MSRSTRFSVAVHILAVLALKPNAYLSSPLIAESVGTNSVVVRRMLAKLQKAGMVICQSGVHGGAKLAVEPRDVTLLDVYDCVEEGALFRVHQPHPKCPVACSVRGDLQLALEKADEGMRAALSKIPLLRITQHAKREYQKRMA